MNVTYSCKHYPGKKAHLSDFISIWIFWLVELVHNLSIKIQHQDVYKLRRNYFKWSLSQYFTKQSFQEKTLNFIMNEYENLKPSLSLPQFHKNPSTGSICTLVTNLHRDAKIWRLSPLCLHINTNWPTPQIIMLVWLRTIY